MPEPSGHRPGASSDGADHPFQPVLGARRGRSMLGKQADSKKATAPMYTFDRTTDRDRASKVFVSSAHTSTEAKCRTGPGAIYDVAGAMDRQVDSMKTTAQRYSFSKTDRFKSSSASEAAPPPGSYDTPAALGAQTSSQKASLPQYSFSSLSREQATRTFRGSDFMREKRGTMGAEPGTYVTPGALGQQPNSPKRTLPAYSFSKTDRLKDDYEKAAGALPPVGAYETWASMGKQPLSLFKSLPSWAFGRSSWDTEDKRFLSPGHASRTLLGAETKHYDAQTEATLTAFGKQQLSTRTNPVGTKFGSTPRLAGLYKTSNTPGPGHYDN